LLHNRVPFSVSGGNNPCKYLKTGCNPLFLDETLGGCAKLASRGLSPLDHFASPFFLSSDTKRAKNAFGFLVYRHTSGRGYE
jgi:hypothetical protein